MPHFGVHPSIIALHPSDKNIELCSWLRPAYDARMLITILLAAALAPATAPAGAAERNAVVVRVYDGARTSAADLHEAERVSSRIVSSVGVRVIWKRCAPAGSHDADQCTSAPGSQELLVRLVAGGAESGPAILGSAHVPGILATLFVDRIRDAASRNTKPMAPLLGAVLAHEVVHLLLGSQGHLARGLLQAAWTDEEIRLGWIWLIGPNDDERRTIAAAIRGRLSAPPITVARGSSADVGK
jgi:hypothetical protein